MSRRIFVSALAAGSCAAFAAAAQTSDNARGEALQEYLAEQAATRPRVNAPPVGVPAQETVESDINWTEMQTELALTQRREIAARQTVTAVVARPPGMRAASVQSYDNVVVREVNVARLPVLAPEGAQIAETLKIYSVGDSYSAKADVEDGVAMRMSGARKKIVVGGDRTARTRIAAMRADRKMLGSVAAPYLISRSESSTDLSFAKFGAGYVLSIMCDDPADQRCADDAYIVKLASNLILLNPDAEGR